MTTKIQFRNLALAFVILTGTLLAGCKDIFKDPSIDKVTEQPVTFLLMDRNFIKTKIDIHLQDMFTHEPIENEQVGIRFSGEDASNLIDFEGYRHTDFNTNSGYIEIGYDPNIIFNAEKPIELTIMVGSNNYMSAPQFISYSTDGTKDLVINLIHKPTLKSASIGAYGEPFDLSYNGQLNSPYLVYLFDFSSFPTGTAYEYMNLYVPVVEGSLLSNNLKDNVLYSDYGTYSYTLSGTPVVPPALPAKDKTFNAGDYVYTTVLKSGISTCNDGLTLHVERADGGTGTGVFDYKITFSDGKIKTGKISCTFPSNNLIEQLYYPASDPAVKVELMGDSQYTISSPIDIISPCGAKASFVVTPKTDLKKFKVITRYSCPESTIGIALSIIGEFRKKGSTDTWTLYKFIEGVADLQLVADSDYDFRINIQGEYYNFSLPTNPDNVKSYLENTQSVDFKFKNLTVVSNATSGTITTDVQFNKSICNFIK